MNSKPKVARAKSSAALVKKISARARDRSLRAFVEKLLLELCRVDTTPNPDIAVMRDAENACFQILERELKALSFGGARLERRPINPAIESHRNYSLLHFTKTPARPRGLSPQETYAGRSNLVYLAPGAHRKSSGLAIALNAHVDVVAPYFPPRVMDGFVCGRGACDDKGPVVAMVAALRLLSEVLAGAGLVLNKNIVAMFVVEEETGGNGSLSLATDRELKKWYDSILVGECAGLKIYPANRGAVWYRADLKPPAGASAFEMAAFVIEEMEKEGAAIRAESRHPLFPQRPVQTCHGIMGPFGEHPSRICGRIVFQIQFARKPDAKIETLALDCLESGLAQYIGIYGDKTKVTDPATGQPMVARHYDLRRRGHGFEITVHGATGHMGAIRERDGAITKMACLVRSLILSKSKLVAAGGPVQFELGEISPKGPRHAPLNQPERDLRVASTSNSNGTSKRHECRAPTPAVSSRWPTIPPLPAGEGRGEGESSEQKPRLVHAQAGGQSLVLEGGQGFVPTHGIDEVMERMRRAAQRGAENYLRQIGQAMPGAQAVSVVYEKLHNAAFDGDPDSPTMRNAIHAAKSCGLWFNEPVRGWTVSCDARLFATEYPDMPVLTFGPGELALAHSDLEQIALRDVAKAAEFLALFLLRQTGTL